MANADANQTTPSPAPQPDRRAMMRKRGIFWGQILLVVAILIPLVWGYVFQPLKYRYLIWRVETAQTSKQERAAFRLAADWGRVYEVMRADPQYIAAKKLPSPDAPWLRIQWLNGKVVYHNLIDTNNLPILIRKKYSHGFSESLL